MNSIFCAWLRLFRVQNAVIAGAGVWLGWFSLRALRPDASSTLPLAIEGSISMALLTMAGNADNDVCDLETDRVNRPNRPLPAGLLTTSSVRPVTWLFYALAIAVAWAASPLHGSLTAGMALLLWVYNRHLKGLPLIGNLAVSLLCALAIYFPEFPGWPQAVFPACAFAFLATLAREIVKDIEDVEGDKRMGFRTFPIVSSLNAARKLAFSLVALLLAFLPLPVAFFGYRWPYLVLATVGVAPFLIALFAELSKLRANYGRCQRYLKWVMLGGMAALWVGVLR
jgi:4-hydroxybenzoate polyprenyltransferase